MPDGIAGVITSLRPTRPGQGWFFRFSNKTGTHLASSVKPAGITGEIGGVRDAMPKIHKVRRIPMVNFSALRIPSRAPKGYH